MQATLADSPAQSACWARKGKNMNYPKHAYRSAREFKAKKRSDVKYAIDALSALRFGCAYTPAVKNILRAAMLLEEAKKMMSAKEWGR